MAYDRALEAVKKLAPIAEEAGIQIGLENVWNSFLLSPLEFRDFIDKVGSPNVGIYLDTGNMRISGYPEQWIKIMGKRIFKVHFKDFRVSCSDMVDLLAGDVDWPKVMAAFKAVGYEGWASAEMIPAYTHASTQIVYNTSASMDRIMKGDF